MWEVLDSYFTENGIVRQQIDSYNQFVNDICEVIGEYGKFRIVTSHQWGIGSTVVDDVSWDF